MGTTLWEPAGPARLTKIDSEEKTEKKNGEKENEKYLPEGGFKETDRDRYTT